MVVTIRLFARLREIAGAGDVQRTLPEGATAADAWQSLVADHPALMPYTKAISCAVNGEYSKPAARIRDGDEVAFLPPVSGG